MSSARHTAPIGPAVALARRVTVVVCLILAVTPVASLGQDWHWQNPLPQGNTLRSFCFANPLIGWTVGNAGAILHTTDGGTWIPQQSNTTFNLRSVCFINTTTGWIAGNAGTLLYTSDGGSNWTTQASNTTRNLFSMIFTSPLSGWAVGDDGTVIHTLDGGIIWSAQNSGTLQNLHAVTFTDDNNGWAAGLGGIILHTSNGGANWVQQPSGFNWDLYSVTFIDNNNGWAVGLSDSILHTTNGGLNWTVQPSGSGQDLYSVTFTSTQTGWVAGLFGTILHTTDGGSTWTTQTSGAAERLETVLFIDAMNGWAAGTAGVILHTSDAGTTWTPQTTGTTAAMLSICFVDSNTGWSVGLSGTIRHTTNSGTLWSAQTGMTAHALRSVYFVDTARGWLVGDLGTLEHTTNGGSTWVSQASGVTQHLRGISFTDAGTGWAVGDAGTILHTTNGGAIWSIQSSGTTANLHALCFVDPMTLWTVGTTGTILHTTNGGTTWVGQSSGLNTNFLSVFFADALTGWIGGEMGTILHTTDGGTSWTAQTSGTTLPMSSIFFSDPVHGLITGGAGKILHTTNGGIDWVPQASGTTQWLFSSSFTDANRGWAVGQEGAIIHTTTGGSGNTPPPSPALLTPADSALASINPHLTWSPVSGARWYSVQLSRTPSFAVKLVNTISIDPTWFAVSKLDEDSTYYWRVSVTTDESTSGWSEVRSFRTGRVPSQVALLSPEDGSLISTDSISVVWQPSRFEVDRYWVEWATDSTFTLSEIDSSITDTAMVIVNLDHYETTWWKVRAHNAVGWGEFSEVRDFFTYYETLPPPALVFPPDRATNLPSTIPLVWRTVTPAPGIADTVLYHIQLSADPIFDSLIVNDSTLVDTTFTVSSLDDNTIYYWRIRARDPFSTSGWSDNWRFRTLPPLPTQVAPLSPTDGATLLVDSVSFLWRTGEPNVDRYRLDIAIDSTFSAMVTDSSITDTTTLVRNLIHHQTYYWRIRAHNARGWGEPGPVWSFFVLVNTPSSPLLVNPPDAASGLLLTVDFTWRTVNPEDRETAARSRGRSTARDRLAEGALSGPGSSDSISYHLQLAVDPAFVDLVVDDSTLADTTISITSLAEGTSYYWRVRARNMVGPGTWSATWSFSTLGLPGRIALALPGDGAIIADTTVMCHWFQGTPAIDAYWFEWADNPEFASSEIDSSVTDTIAIAAPLLGTKSYFWRVRGHNAIGWGEFSEVRTFSVLISGVEDIPDLPTQFRLSQNYPNPFNPTTVIRYELPLQTHVLLELFNMVGQRVAILVDEEQIPGYHAKTLEAGDLSSGTYLYRLHAGDFVETRKLLLIR